MDGAPSALGLATTGRGDSVHSRNQGPGNENCGRVYEERGVRLCGQGSSGTYAACRGDRSGTNVPAQGARSRGEGGAALGTTLSRPVGKAHLPNLPLRRDPAF